MDYTSTDSEVKNVQGYTTDGKGQVGGATILNKDGSVDKIVINPFQNSAKQQHARLHERHHVYMILAGVPGDAKKSKKLKRDHSS